MSQIKVLRTDSFVGGLNLRADPFQLGLDESPDMLNVDIDPRGGFGMRGGVTRLNPSAVGALGAGTFTPKKLWVWERPSSQLFVAANSKVYYASSTTFTDTTIATTAAHGASFAAWSGISERVYVAGGNGGVVNKWDGTTKTALTASATAAWQETYGTPTGTHAPKSDHIAAHANRMFVASTVEDAVTYPNRIRFSHEGFPESWRSLDYIDIVDGGSGITALIPFQGALYIFKKSSVHMLLGIDTDTFVVQRVTDTLGTPSPRAVVATEAGIYFFSWPDGVFRLDGTSITNVGMSIQPLIQTQQVTETSITNLDLAWVNRRLWVSIPQATSTTASFTYVLDPTIGKRGAWTKYALATGGGFGPGCDFVNSTNSRTTLACHPTEPYVLKCDQPYVYQDDIGTPTNFASYYVTRWHDASNVSTRKMWRRPDLVVDQPSVTTVLTCEAFHDWEESLVKRTFLVNVTAAPTGMLWQATAAEPDGLNGWGEAAWGAPATGAQFERGSNLGLARSIQLKVKGPGGKPWGVNSISYKYNPRKIRG